jgi:hypothetical protein
MSRFLLRAGLLGGLLLTLSAIAHSTGWAAQFAEAVGAVALAPELVDGLQIGWYFGSFCMAGFGLIATAQAWRGLRGRPVDRVTTGVIGATLIVFGIWAMFFGGYNPFFFLFIVLGVLIGATSVPPRSNSRQ